MHDLALGFGFGIVTASILALSALALSLQYSVTSIPNFAHGQLLALGAYGAYVTQGFIDNVIAEALVAFLIGAAAAWFMNVALIRPMVEAKAAPVVLFVVTLAFGFFLEGAVLLSFGGGAHAYTLPESAAINIGPFQFTGRGLAVIAASVVVMLIVHAILRYSKFGKSQRAVADSRELARVSGIRADRVIALTWLMAGGIAGFAGFVLGASVGSFGPPIGTNFLLVTFAAAVLGGLGKPYGAMVGALIIGVTMEISALYTAANYKDSIAFAVLVLALLIRPNGIFSVVRGSFGAAQ
jgi:branched-subunit amino acid ABC-type transport system permease component